MDVEQMSIVPKQVIVVRKELNMRKGKMCAMAAHASMKVLLDRMEQHQTEYNYEDTFNGKERGVIRELVLEKDDPINIWLEGAFTKIVVGVSDEEFLWLHQALMTQGKVPFAVITDNGATEFHGVKTDTCIAVGPAAPEDVDMYTNRFKLL
jgi:PTH2 family peptidyl-tRNA hydrolase